MRFEFLSNYKVSAAQWLFWPEQSIISAFQYVIQYNEQVDAVNKTTTTTKPYAESLSDRAGNDGSLVLTKMFLKWHIVAVSRKPRISIFAVLRKTKKTVLKNHGNSCNLNFRIYALFSDVRMQSKLLLMLTVADI